VNPISTTTARITAPTAIWKTHEVTWDEGVMDVSGVISSCANAVPEEGSTSRTDPTTTQPHLQSECRTRTSRILTAGVWPSDLTSLQL
jgi:hypothetical protein